MHAPELFAGDHTLDLCNSNDSYRQHSIVQLQRVVNISRNLRRRFQCPNPVLLVTNVCGFSEHRHLESREKDQLLSYLLDGLQQINTFGEVEIIPQTMLHILGISEASAITISLLILSSFSISVKKLV